MTDRLKYIDVIAGIMIAWMILGHCSYFAGCSIPYYSILGFYMPWFFYKSGMLFKSKNSKELLKKDSKKYLIPFLLYSFIGWCVWTICCLIDGSQSLNECLLKPLLSIFKAGNIPGNGALWFLLSLFIIRQISNVLINKHIAPPYWQ